MRLAGGFDMCEEELFYKGSDMQFYSDEAGTVPVPVSDLEIWAVLINSPWSQADERYEIKCNCINAYIPMDKEEPTWKCTYSIMGYDCLTAEVIGYGDTEEEALNDCKQLFVYLQEHYNADGENV